MDDMGELMIFDKNYITSLRVDFLSFLKCVKEYSNFLIILFLRLILESNHSKIVEVQLLCKTDSPS